MAISGNKRHGRGSRAGKSLSRGGYNERNWNPSRPTPLPKARLHLSVAGAPQGLQPLVSNLL